MILNKELVYTFLSKNHKEHWLKNNKINVLIDINSYFKQSYWNSNLYINSVVDKVNVIYSSNKFKTYKLIADADYYFCFSLNNTILHNAQKLRFAYVGVRGEQDKIDLPFKIYNIPPFAKTAIAEYVLGVLLIMIRRLDIPMINKPDRKWEQCQIIKNGIKSISDLTVGIFGFGEIGKEIGKNLKNNGCKIAVCDINNQSCDYVDFYFSSSEIKIFFQKIDVLVIALPLNDETRNYFNQENLNNLKNGVYLVNISRGGFLYDDIILRLLKNGKIKFAALDVFNDEPLSKKSKLWKLDNLYISPHISGNINYFVNDIQNDFIKKIIEDIS